MTATVDLLQSLKCLMLRESSALVSYYNLDIKCPEIEEVEQRFKTSVKYHLYLSKSDQFGCDIDSDTLCSIEAFVKANPCTCLPCNSTCAAFDIDELIDGAVCEGFTIVEILEDL